MKMSQLSKARVPRLNTKLINYMKKLVNLRDHCPPELVYRQTRKQPHFGIRARALPQLKFLDMTILLHFRKS
jgi:hypothetical protein